MSVNKNSRSVAGWNPADHANALSACQKRMAAIRAGKSTRKDLKEIFTEAGGISNRGSGRYEYKESPYVYVDVEFDFVEDKENMKVEHLSDKIKRISEPYISPAIDD